MRQRRYLAVIGGLILVVILAEIMRYRPTLAQASFADPAFQRAWERSDKPVADGRAARSWTWGPQAGATRGEPYGANGATRLVQYFDKARMEINNPNGNPQDPFFVTNGRLVVELISGRIQVGPNEYENTTPAEIPIAGDVVENNRTPYPVVGGEVNGLTYASLYHYANIGGAGSRAPVLAPGTMIRTWLDRGGQPFPNATPGSAPGGPGSLPPVYPYPYPTPTIIALPDDPQTAIAVYIPETGHNIPRAFWTFMNARGPVYVNGAYREDTIVNWVAAYGYPITEPYWTTIRVEGQSRLVLFQAFERRVLTYTPTNPPPWRVEMGNVGRHYQDWRYAAPRTDCATYPVRGIGQVWAERSPVGLNMGCPTEPAPVAGESAVEHFEHGIMIWTNIDPEIGKRIYVLFEDGTYERYADTWDESQPAGHNLTPPPGLYEPQRGFGKLWYEGTGARIRARLGWATDREVGGPAERESFNNGLMIALSPTHQVLVLYPFSAYANAITRAQLYPDTFGR